MILCLKINAPAKPVDIQAVDIFLIVLLFQSHKGKGFMAIDSTLFDRLGGYDAMRRVHKIFYDRCYTLTIYHRDTEGTDGCIALK